MVSSSLLLLLKTRDGAARCRSSGCSTGTENGELRQLWTLGGISPQKGRMGGGMGGPAVPGIWKERLEPEPRSGCRGDGRSRAR